MEQMRSLLQQQAAELADLQRELRDENRLMEQQMNELPMKLENMTASLTSIVADAADAKCILLAGVI